MSRMLNALSIDVEDWFCVHNLKSAVRRRDWKTCESRVVQNTNKILRILEEYDTKATFFVLGWIAENFPDIVRSIDKCGHEIATHGYSHSLLTSLTCQQFDADIDRSLRILGQQTKQEIIGHRAPSFTIVEDTFWALEILSKHGIRYDSSVFPVGFHPDYGINDSPLIPYQISDNLTEFPLSCFKLVGKKIPCCGGAYFRILPYFLTKFGIWHCNRKGRPVIFYLHPWEIDPDQPRVNLPVLKCVRHYYNIDKTEGRLKRLLKDFEFTTVRNVLGL